LRARVCSVICRGSLLGLATLSVVTCTTDSSPSTGAAEQAVVNPPLPTNLNLILNTKNTITIGAFTQVNGDVGSSGRTGSVLFDVSSSQGFFSGFNVLANTVTVNTNASVGHVFGNDLTINGSAAQQSLGLDPSTLPAVPAATPATPGTTNVTVNQNQAKQLCPGQFGAISLGINSTLNLNGGVYQVTRLTLADGARLEPSEPVVILVTGGVTTGVGAFIRPSAQALNPMTAADIRIEVGGAASIGDGTDVRAHLLVPTGKLTTGKNARLTGAAWGKTIVIGVQNTIIGEGVFAAQAPSVPPPCNDNNVCTTDRCVSTGTAAFCQNAPTAAGSSCEDGNACNGAELCDGAGACQPGTNAKEGTSCADGTVCNGAERCDGLGTCEPGTPPVVDDRNSCTADVCDAVDGVSHVPVPDGTRCSGVGVCQGGVCSVSGTVFSEDFVQFQSAPAQCDRWNDFLINQLSDGSYSRVAMSGTFNTTGIACSDPAAATQICQALHSGSFTSVFCDGHSWNIGQCGGTEVSIDTGVCFCNFGTASTVRPCTGIDWGGVATSTCDGPSQNMTVVCE
jgi:hypothetical protein